ncbi:dynein light chain Tctex-type protein 2B isoform X1 [Tiliqua scincoides]|uniref:dynein light chain Tctex-type protein 2B isoform X1 n=1 Tax=Tiliqua scincoides TaxID=71010 RepID=UPI003461E847
MAEAAAPPAPALPRPASASAGGRTYSLRPAFQHKFRSSTVKECIHEVLKEELTGIQYSPEDIPQLTKSLSETIRDKLKEKGFQRYKIIVQVVIGEQRGEGVKTVSSVWWSPLAASSTDVTEAFKQERPLCLSHFGSKAALVCSQVCRHSLVQNPFYI